MSDKLIPLQAAVDALKQQIEEMSHWSERYAEQMKGILTAINIVSDLPSAQPEIIRCKDCRYYEWMSNRVPAEQTWFCHNWNAETGKNDFCSYAERREG